jgi:ankyrin repeat protein
VKANLELHEAVEAGDTARAEALLARDAYQTKAKDVFGQTALHRAAVLGRAELTRLLLDHAAAVDPVSHAKRTPLHHAAELGHLAVAEALLAHKAKPNAMSEGGETPLHLAARNGHLDIVRLLLAKGADPNLMGEYGGSPLHEAAANGRHDVAEVLLAAGAMANAQSKGAASAWTPWNEARKAGHGELAELLRRHGGEDRARGPLDIHRASERGYIGRVQVLLDTEPGLVDSRDFLNRRTALHWAAERGDLAIAELLLSRGAARDLTDKPGHTPLDLALDNGHAAIADCLKA